MSPSRASPAGQALRWSRMAAAATGTRADRCRSSAACIRGVPRSRLASCCARLSCPRLVQTCGSTPSPWIGQPRGASTRLHVTNSSPPSGSLPMVCTSPLPSVELPTTTARPLSARAAVRISAELAVRPSTRTMIGTPEVRSPDVAAHRWNASGFRPSVTAMIPASSNMSAAVTAWRNTPPRFPRRSSTSPRGRRPAGTVPLKAVSISRANCCAV